MKNKGVLYTIVLILILGAAVTISMYRFVTTNTASSPAPETALTEEKAAPAEIYFEETAEDTDAGEENAGIALAGESPETDGEEEKAAQAGMGSAKEESLPKGRTSGSSAEDTVLSPLAKSHAVAVQEDLATKESFRLKLEEIDLSIKELRESDTSANTDSAKKAAEYEYRLWDAELNRIYNTVLASMTEEEAEKLRSEEVAWIRERDMIARQAAAKKKGGAIENLEYTVSLSDSTRARAYELLEQYGDLLAAEE